MNHYLGYPAFAGLLLLGCGTKSCSMLCTGRLEFATGLLAAGNGDHQNKRTRGGEISRTSLKNEEYNQIMQREMLNPYEYHHTLGMYYTRIEEKLIVGSQPQNRDDINFLYDKEHVRSILNLQQDKDIAYWGVELDLIMQQCEELGISYTRNPAKDFDPLSLRQELPRAVSIVASAIDSGQTVYVHCTAGLGRAPAIAIAYLYWFRNMNMNTAYDFLTAKRPCGPRKEAIRGATYDLAKQASLKTPFESLPDFAFTDITPWERKLIQDRVRKLMSSML